jgi:hypothetical protein
MKRLVLVLLFALPAFLSALIIDHTCVDITQIPESAILAAKDSLHIGYGHTSHGWQITYGMDGLVEFANNGGKGLSLPEDIFAFNNGGAGGALDFEDGDGYGEGWLDHDCGYYPNWVDETREYLDDPSHSDVNVIMWSWCGQVSSTYCGGVLWDQYLGPMTQLEIDYPHVTFIYMTGHVDIGQDSCNKAANDSIRSYCRNNDKVLFDFADFDRHDPDGTYYEFVHDNCDYYDAVGGTHLGNWALEWQESHTEGVDWYSTPGSHTYPINENQKGYAAWWMWARLGGWEGPAGVEERPGTDDRLTLSANNNINITASNQIDLSFSIPSDGLTAIDAYNVSGAKISSIFRGYLSAGSHSCSWDRNGKSGVIIIKLKHSSGITSVKLNCI